MRFQEKDIRKIKLIIWDLDDTFWKGTLSDNGNDATVVPITENIQLVKTLTRRGIINSICSKNDAQTAKAELKRQGVASFFVFTSIDWTPKGQRIKRMISDMALRETNVLFLDDNPSNLGEAEYACPQLMIASPSEAIPCLIQHAETLGKDDSGMSRLKQYRVLEHKRKDSRNFSSNEDFLRSSGIKICIQTDLHNQTDRIAELIARSNQLNFTKKRITKDELCSLLADPTVEAGSVQVADNYGAYGLVGFYAMRDHVLEHFLFSCRTMGMGIEQYVYARLGFPALTVVPPVSGAVSREKGLPDYITEVKSLDKQQFESNASTRYKILLKGPCDLQVMASYIERASSDITTEFNFIDRNGNQADFYNHSVHILNSLSLPPQTWQSLCHTYPFLSEEALSTTLFSKAYDLICLSPLMDATLGVYTDDNGLCLPMGLYNKPLTDPNFKDDYIQQKVMTAHCRFDAKSIELFSGQFHPITLTAQEIAQNWLNIVSIVTERHPSTRFVLLLLPERPYHYAHHSPYAFLQGKEQNHRDINNALRNAFRNKKAVYLLDINKYIKSQSDYFDNINHYSKLVYYNIAKELIKVANSSGQATITHKSYRRALWDHLKRTLYKILVLRTR